MSVASSFSRRLFLLPLGAAAIAAACSDSSSTGGSGGVNPCPTPTDKNGCFNEKACYVAGPTRSFKKDVEPIFEQSCSLSAVCHGDPSSPTTSDGYQMFLGSTHPDQDPTDTEAVLKLIDDVASPTATNEKIVDPGKPESSFLMQKLDGTLSCTAITCKAPTDGSGGKASWCGTSMPQMNDTLPLETRNIVRDWIKQGALHN